MTFAQCCARSGYARRASAWRSAGSCSPKATGIGPEGQARLETFEKTGLGDLYFADPDGVFIAVKERSKN